MYKFPIKLKIGAIVLMVLGLVFTAISFLQAPKTLDEAKEIIKKRHEAHAVHDSHGSKGHDSSSTKDLHIKKDVKAIVKHHNNKHSEASVNSHVKTEEVNQPNENQDNAISVDVTESVDPKQENVKDVNNDAKPTAIKNVKNMDTVVKVPLVKNFIVNTFNRDKDLLVGKDILVKHNSIEKASHVVSSDNVITSHLNTTTHSNVSANHDGSHHDADHHAEHLFHQMQNRPVAAFYVAMLFFLGVTLLVMAFYAGQRIAQAGWSVVIFRVFEAISANLHYVSVFMLLFIIGTVLHKFHLFPWMKEGVLDPSHPNYDSIIYGKKWWMNIPGWATRSVIYLLIWNVLRFIIRRMSIKQDNGDLKLHKRLFNMSVLFIFTFMFTESMMSWDWIMGIDPHWFSTLFAWYVLATFIVCALTVTALVTIYLRSQGALPLVNDSHIHDLAKFMFGLSVFWTYLWFAQYMLVWYADMPEETTYYLQRFNDYNGLFLGMVAMNFILPVLILLNSDFKSIPWFVVIAGVIILVGHYLDLYVMIMPGTVGGEYGFGFGEFGGILFFLGLFIFATFNSFAKADPVPKGNPFLHESETFHYYIIEHRGEEGKNHH